MSELRVGIAGAGYIARAHARAYAATPGVRIVGIGDPVPAKAEQLAGETGSAAFGSLDQLLSAGVDAISICTPTPTHCELVLTALDAGVSVLCEKPIAYDLADADRMIVAAARTQGMLMVGHVSRFEPEHARARQIVAAGKLGEVHMSSQTITAAAPGWSEGGWLHDHAQSGGPIMDLAIHSFDYLAWIHGSVPVRVIALAADTDAGMSTYALVTLRMANGSIATVETSWAHPVAHGFRLVTEIAGSDGRLDWTYDGVMLGSMIDCDAKTTLFDSLGDRGFRSEVAAFVNAIRQNLEPPVTATEARTALATAVAARESVRTGRPVTIEQGGAG